MNQAVEYIFVAMLFTNIMLCFVFVVAWVSISKKPYVLIWAIAFAVATINILINAMKGLFPSNEMYWIIVNLSSLIVQALSLSGFRQRSILSMAPSWLLIYIAFILCILSYFTVLSPHFGIRVSLIPYSAVLMCFGCIYAILHTKRRLRLAEVSCIGIYCIFAVLQFSTGTAALLQGVDRVDAYQEVYQQINFLAMPASYVGLGLFAVLILTDDLSAKMRFLANSDPLTAMLNRRGVEEKFNKLITASEHNVRGVYIILADIDHFKKINDRYGHHTGDVVLMCMASLLTQNLRGSDFAGRLGGEEFIIVLHADNMHAAKDFTERIRKTIEQREILAAEHSIKLTMSFGIVEYNETHKRIFDAVNDADKLLYKAKNTGRNRVEVMDE